MKHFLHTSFSRHSRHILRSWLKIGAALHEVHKFLTVAGSLCGGGVVESGGNVAGGGGGGEVSRSVNGR